MAISCSVAVVVGFFDPETANFLQQLKKKKNAFQFSRKKRLPTVQDIFSTDLSALQMKMTMFKMALSKLVGAIANPYSTAVLQMNIFIFIECNSFSK